MGEGEGGMIWENGIVTCIMSYAKQIASLGSMPGLGTKIPHATEQLSPRATTTDSEHHSKSPGAATKDPAWDMEAT